MIKPLKPPATPKKHIITGFVFAAIKMKIHSTEQFLKIPSAKFLINTSRTERFHNNKHTKDIYKTAFL